MILLYKNRVFTQNKKFGGGESMKQYPTNIVSEVEALRTKESERDFFKVFKSQLPGNAIMKVTPFKGFHADFYYEEDGEIAGTYHNILIKCMDTFEETFSILEEELIEIMMEEEVYRKEQMKVWGEGYHLPYIYFMPYVDLSHRKDEFTKKHIIDKTVFTKIKKGKIALQDYMGQNNEIFSNLMRYYLAKEYHVIKKEADERVINKDFKKIVFAIKDHDYQAISLTDIQIRQICSVKYGNTLYIGPAGAGKTTTMLARAMKLSKIYSKDRFLFITFNRQLMTDLSKYRDMMGEVIDNLEIINFHSFILNISKGYSLKIDAGSKKTFNQQFDFIFNKVTQIFTDHSVYKGIFVDEAENFKEEHLAFLKNLLYKKRHFFMISSDKGKDILGAMENFIGGWEKMDFEDVWEFRKNYRGTKTLTQFTNQFIENLQNYCQEKKLIIPQDYYIKSTSQRIKGKKVTFVRSDTVEGKLANIVGTIKELTEKKGIAYSDICVVFPFNKRKIKPGNTIYFQYMLREILQKSEIPFIMAHEDISSLTYKSGVTISNIFSVNNLEFKTVILCELEMLYTHSLPENYSPTEAQSFVRSMNMIYTAMTRATDSLYIITLLDDHSQLYQLLNMEKKES